MIFLFSSLELGISLFIGQLSINQLLALICFPIGRMNKFSGFITVDWSEPSEVFASLSGHNGPGLDAAPQCHLFFLIFWPEVNLKLSGLQTIAHFCLWKTVCQELLFIHLLLVSLLRILTLLLAPYLSFTKQLRQSFSFFLFDPPLIAALKRAKENNNNNNKAKLIWGHFWTISFAIFKKM